MFDLYTPTQDAYGMDWVMAIMVTVSVALLHIVYTKGKCRIDCQTE